MPLEATMILLDNSSHSINGDYLPTRFQAQADASTTVFNTKTLSNAESEVGLMTMAGKGPQVLVTPTKEIGAILTALHDIKQSGEADLVTSIQVAQLALKHRSNKNQRQRLVIFVSSPLTSPSTSIANLEKLAKKIKKNNVAVDVILLEGHSAEEASIIASLSAGASNSTSAVVESTEDRLRKFVESVNSSDDNSHFLLIPPGVGLVSDVLSTSTILSEDLPSGGGGNMDGDAMGRGGGFAETGGIDPSADPELAMALRMSLEEEQARQRAAAAASTSTSTSIPSTIPEEEVPLLSGEGGNKKRSGSETPTTGTPPTKKVKETEDVDMEEEEEEEEDELARALALSRGDEDVDMDDDEEEQMRKALEMSLKDADEENKKK